MKAKVALLGCGNPAQKWHLPTLSELAKRGDIEFVALCDMVEDIAAASGTKYGVPYYTNLDEMLDRHKDILVVDIVTGDPTHHVLACQLAERGKHVMVEKPMALTLACCDLIIDTCRRNGVRFEVAENYFRMPKQRMIVKLIREGILGDILRVYFSEPKRQVPFEPRVTPSGLMRPISGFGRTSGMCMDMGAHRLSQLRLYAQSDPRQVSAIVKKYHSDPNRVHEDWAHAVIEFENGATGIYETSRLGELQKYCQITGTRGSILDLDYFGPNLPLRLLTGESWEEIPVRTERRTIDGVDVLQRIVVETKPEIIFENRFRDHAIDDWSVGHADEIMSIAKAALNDEPAEYCLEGRKDVEMAMAIYESSLLGNGAVPVQLPLESITDYERMVHDDYQTKFDRQITHY
ncbi:MAG: Gfo/Idh/MocA family oxidoreductase [Gammaproteobacteria bacterium]|nr:Gfo/Idh/MocA family oxidoreductase [Gammaproteobacteria bacterium]